MDSMALTLSLTLIRNGKAAHKIKIVQQRGQSFQNQSHECFQKGKLEDIQVRGNLKETSFFIQKLAKAGSKSFEKFTRQKFISSRAKSKRKKKKKNELVEMVGKGKRIISQQKSKHVLEKIEDCINLGITFMEILFWTEG